jgi:hypothetical protein
MGFEPPAPRRIGEVWMSGTRFEVVSVTGEDGALAIQARAEPKPEQWEIPAGRHPASLIGADGERVTAAMWDVGVSTTIAPNTPAILKFYIRLGEPVTEE